MYRHTFQLHVVLVVVFAWVANSYGIRGSGYADEVAHEFVYLNSNNEPICQRGWSPVCATDGYAFLYFEDECRFKAYNLRQLFAYRMDLTRTDLRHCFSDCALISCDPIYNPMCGKHVGTNYLRSFPNSCEMIREMCITGSQWQLATTGPCRHPTKCASLCTTDYYPVCAAYNGVERTFANECELKDYICKTGLDWTIIRPTSCEQTAPPCGYAKTETVVCSSNYAPVCASNSGQLKTFANQCELNVENQNSTHSWQTVYEGKCKIEAPYPPKPTTPATPTTFALKSLFENATIIPTNIHQIRELISTQDLDITTENATASTQSQSSSSHEMPTSTPEDLPSTPQVVTSISEDSTSSPKEPTAFPGESTSTPDESNSATDKSTSTTEESTSTPEEVTSTSEDSTSSPKKSTAIPGETAFTPKESSSTTDKSTSTTEESASTPEEATSTSEDSTSSPKESSAIPGETTFTPEEFTSTTDKSTSTAEELTSTPEGSTLIRDEATSTPEQLTSTPKELTSTPQELTSTSEGSSSKLEESTSAPEDSSSTPKESTSSQDISTSTKESTIENTAHPDVFGQREARVTDDLMVSSTEKLITSLSSSEASTTEYPNSTEKVITTEDLNTTSGADISSTDSPITTGKPITPGYSATSNSRASITSASTTVSPCLSPTTTPKLYEKKIYPQTHVRNSYYALPTHHPLPFYQHPYYPQFNYGVNYLGSPYSAYHYTGYPPRYSHAYIPETYRHLQTSQYDYILQRLAQLEANYKRNNFDESTTQ